MKRREHGALQGVYVRGEPELAAAIDAARAQHGDAENEWISRGEMARRLLWWAVHNLRYAAPADPKDEPMRLVRPALEKKLLR